MPFFDLTRPLSDGMPVYPGDPPVRFRRHLDYTPDGCRVTEVRLATHAGTHVDAPAHFLNGGASVDLLPLQQLIGAARVVEIGELDEVAPGERILIRSGWGDRWGTPGYFEAFPGLLPAEAELLASAPAALIGLETPSLHPDHEVDLRLHRMLLARRIVIVENLVGLDRLPEEIWLAVLPLPLARLDGSPCRVIAAPAGAALESELTT
jgi:arylformamidase